MPITSSKRGSEDVDANEVVESNYQRDMAYTNYKESFYTGDGKS